MENRPKLETVYKPMIKKVEKKLRESEVSIFFSIDNRKKCADSLVSGTTFLYFFLIGLTYLNAWTMKYPIAKKLFCNYI